MAEARDWGRVAEAVEKSASKSRNRPAAPPHPGGGGSRLETAKIQESRTA